MSNWNAAARAVADFAPALTVHLGDISLDGENHPEEVDYAAGLTADWPTPMRCLPGNHDMGTGCGEEPLSGDRLARYRRTLGADHWLQRSDDWVLIGMNAQLLGAGGPAEAAQWAWLEDQVGALRNTDRVVLCLHRPLVRAPGDDGMPSRRYVCAAAADRLLRGPLRKALRLVISGHTHQALDFVADDVRHVWVPSSGFVIPDALQARVGDKVVGIGLLKLDAREAHYLLIRPPGLRPHLLTGLACFAEPRTLGAPRS